LDLSGLWRGESSALAPGIKREISPAVAEGEINHKELEEIKFRLRIAECRLQNPLVPV
jgi:hypothetical protein